MLKKILFIGIVAGLGMSTNAQTSRSDPNDIEGWAGVGLNLNLPKKWDADLTYQTRRQGNISTLRGNYWSPEIGKSLTKGIRTFVNYRYANTVNGNSSRIGWGWQFNGKIKKWTLDFRPQMQYTIQFADDGDVTNNTKWILRTRLQARKKLSKKTDLYFSSEPYLTFEKGEFPIDNIRNTIGLKYQWIKNSKVDFFYIYRPDFAKSYNRTFHVLGIMLDIDLKIK
jgi:hypothetical protein